MSTFQVLFDNFDLNTIPYLEFVRRYPNNEADIEMTSHDMLRRDGTLLTSVRHKSKQLALEGFINAPNRTSYEETLDILKYRTSGLERPLVIQQAGSLRSYIATKQNIVDSPIEGGKSQVNLAFLCSDPFGKAGNLTEYTEVVTGASVGLAHTFIGTSKAHPIFTVTVGSLSGGTAKYVAIGNSSTGQQVSVTRTWTAGDVVQFDMYAHKVYVNDVLTGYDGVFPSFAPNYAHATYADNLTTRSATVKLAYTAEYL